MGNTATIISHKNSTLDGNDIRRVHWGSSGLPAPPGKPILIPSFTEDSQPIIVGIRWERSGYNGGSAIIGYLVEHRRLGSPHWVKSSPGLCTFPELTLTGLEPGWRYQFRVRAQNSVGLSQASELSDPLTVTLQRAAVSPPKFTIDLKDTIALENEQVEFVVHFSGTPIPKISWFKDGFEIFSSRRTKIITENGKSSLLIHQTALNDQGEIKCTASNRAGHVTSRGNLILEALPKIRLPRQYEDGLLFEKGETIKLKISIAGRPLPKVIWYHNGTLISPDNRHLIESIDGGEYSLTIVAAIRQDRGEYSVKAVNKLGEDVASFLITVTDRPATPGKIIIAMTLGRSVSLSWNEPDDDGGCKIGTYIVEYYRIGWDVWLKASTCRQPSITLGDLIGDSEYKFRVKAENPYGVSEPSEESDVIFIPQAKDKSMALSPSLDRSQEISYLGREIEKHFYDSAQASKARSKSLTRDEKTYDYLETVRLTKPARSDSRVTFAETVYHLEKPSVAQVKPPRTKRDKLLNANNNSHISKTLSSDNIDDSLISKLDYQDLTEKTLLTHESKVPPSSSSEIYNFENIEILQTSTIELSNEKPLCDEDDKDNRINDEEFMLVLYPDDKNSLNENMKSKEDDDIVDNIDEDLVPPPMSRSLPELFSKNHSLIEVIRNAFSSTELLHERALEKFYRAVAIEEKEETKKNSLTIEKLNYPNNHLTNNLPSIGYTNQQSSKEDEMIFYSQINSPSQPAATIDTDSETEINHNNINTTNNYYGNDEENSISEESNNDKLLSLPLADDSSVVQLKSILKKRTEEVPIINSMFQEEVNNLSYDNNSNKNKNIIIQKDELNHKMSTSDTESDTNTNINLMNVAEVAKNRRRLSTKHQIEQKLSSLQEDNVSRENIEAERALIDHYTEIVREHSIHISSNLNRHKSPTEATLSTQAANNSNINREDIVKEHDALIIDQTHILPANQSLHSMSLLGESKKDNKKSVTKTKTQVNNSNTSIRQSSSKVELGNSSRDSSMSRSSSKTRKKKRESLKNNKLQLSEKNKWQDRPIKLQDEMVIGNNNNNNANKDQIGKASAVETQLKVQSAMSYTTDVILFLGALYIYLFEQEILALPFIGLILYRRIQTNLLNWKRH